MTQFRFTNSLIHETSPYLLQHAHNPVEWYGWNEETLSRAKREDKPILLSIGYSACHWCHVMEKESFENDDIAALMNNNFINIKVDREERPDLDQIYQNAVQFFIKRSGGWPLTMFLTPQQIPFYGGTYFPPEDRYNIPGFPRVIEAVSKAYRENREEVIRNTSHVLERLAQIAKIRPNSGDVSPDLIKESVATLIPYYNPTYGGFGGAPKFPSTMILELFLRYYHNTGEETYLKPVLHTLLKMGNGGIYDQLGGGFHRYSVDEKWLVPHFEKMLYDNAQLIPLYFHAFQISKIPVFKQIAVETLDYVLREMTSPEGGFYSTQDADSEGIEGKFFVWNMEEVKSVLQDDEFEIFCRYFDITLQGNFEHRNILNIPRDISILAHEFNMPVEKIEKIIRKGKIKLFEHRKIRIAPFRDEKILTGWNGLMISALIEGFRIAGDKKYLSAAEKAINFVLNHLYKNGLILASYKDGKARLRGYLDDYAFMTAALLDFYEMTFNPEILDNAVKLMDKLLAEFWDKEEGAFYFTGIHHESLISRVKSGHDHSIPSGNSISSINLMRLYAYTEKVPYREFAHALFKIFGNQMKENPFAFGSFLSALDQFQNSSQIILVARQKEELVPWLSGLNELYLPNTTVFPVNEEEGRFPPLNILQGKTRVEGNVTAYFCRNFTCSRPISHWEDFKSLLLLKEA
ncbi:MAG: thioredoxin domain-containing protein [Nitrospiria bacterium]